MHYPSTDEVLRSLGLARANPQPMASDWIAPVAIFSCGLVAGAAAALLLAPKSGRELRHDIGDAVNKAGHDIKEAAQHATESARQALPHFGNDVVDDAVEVAKSAKDAITGKRS